MAVTKSDAKHEYAACQFLKWFTKTENNMRFVCDSGYMPVLKESNDVSKLDSLIQGEGLEVSDKAYSCLTTVMSDFDDTKFYTLKTFDAWYDSFCNALKEAAGQ